VGQDKLKTTEGDEPETFSHTLRVPNLFRKESGRLMGCQTFRECTVRCIARGDSECFLTCQMIAKNYSTVEVWDCSILLTRDACGS